MKCLRPKNFKGIVAAAVILLAAAGAGCGGDEEPTADALDDATDIIGVDTPAETTGDLATDVDRDTARIDIDVAGDDIPGPDIPACDEGQDCSAGPDVVVLGSGLYQVAIDRAAGTITLINDGVDQFVLNFGDIQVGTVPSYDPTLTYDPYPMLAHDASYTAPAGLFWAPLAYTRYVDTVDGVSTFDAAFGTGAKMISATMTLKPSDDGRFAITITPTDSADSVAYFRINPTVTTDENFYGLGAYLDQVAHRGKVRAMQLETDFDIESNYNEAHVPVPLLISTKAWGIFVESWYPGAFDVAAWDPTKVDIVFGTGEGSSEGFKFHLYAAAKPLDITLDYYKDTVAPLLPARWGLGPVVWKDEVTGQAEVEADLHAIRDLGLPTTAYWIDRPYASGVNAFDFNPANYSDPQSMIDLAHDMGFRVMLWNTPYISSGKNGDKESSPTTESLYQAAKDNNFLVKNVLILNKWGEPIDFTNPDAYSWFQSLIRQYTDMGIEGFKLDYGEDIVIGMLGMDVLDTQFFDGSTERTMHAKYQTFYHRIYAETLPSDGGFLICRRGVWGDQANVSVIWPGDLDASFAKHREEVTDGSDTYKAVGGLPASVIYGLSLGVSGFPFFGSDTGGYRHSPAPKELHVRWAQQTALSSIMQVGNSSNTVPWDLNSGIDLDQEYQSIYKRYASLHLRLWPYEWTYAKNIAVTGHPIQRPFGLAYPEMGVHPDDQYMFGDYLLVAPVVTQGAIERDVIFPVGRWYDLRYNKVIVGPKSETVQAPLDTLPLFLAEGGIVPMLRPTIEAVAPVAEGQDIDTLYNNTGILYPIVFAGPPSSFTLYDGAVITQGFTGDTTYDLVWTDGTEFNSGAVFTVLGIVAQDYDVQIDGISIESSNNYDDLTAAGQGWTAEGPALYVKVPGGTHTVTVTIIPVG